MGRIHLTAILALAAFSSACASAGQAKKPTPAKGPSKPRAESVPEAGPPRAKDDAEDESIAWTDDELADPLLLTHV